MLKINTPIPAPIIIGIRNCKFSLGDLKKSSTLFKSFSYIPKITHKTPLLIPGKIAPDPIKIPLKILIIVFINPPFILLPNIFRNKQFRRKNYSI